MSFRWHPLTPDAVARHFAHWTPPTTPWKATPASEDETDFSSMSVWKRLDAHMDIVDGGNATHVDEAMNWLKVMYPMGSAWKTTRNHTDSFRRAMESHPTAQRLGTDLVPLYRVTDWLSADDVRRVLKIDRRHHAKWSRYPPRVCFNHQSYATHPHLTPLFVPTDSASHPSPSRCLSRAASAHVHDRISASRSVFVYRGQERVLDRIAKRVEKEFGLLQTHALSWQILTYPDEEESHYADHVDCRSHDDLHSPARMATLLIYLTDDVEGGETEFPRIGVRQTPRVGTAMVFYNFGPGWDGTQCSYETLHRSNPIRRGTKVVLQRWYSYADMPLLAARPLPIMTIPERVPYQSSISCDFVYDELNNVSCRWYNRDEA